MSAALTRSRDRAVTTMRLLGATVVVLGLTGTGALAGAFARQHAESEPAQPAQAVGTPPRRVIVIVHRTAPAPPAKAGTPAAAPAPLPAPTSVPTVTPPAEPVAPAGTSSGSDPS